MGVSTGDGAKSSVIGNMNTLGYGDSAPSASPIRLAEGDVYGAELSDDLCAERLSRRQP